ncbi:MAG: sensor histidine kinase [Burkholderiaceae bacterium]
MIEQFPGHHDADTLVDPGELEQAYRADSAFVLTLAPWVFVIGMTVEALSHWQVGPAYLFWTHTAIALASLGLLIAIRRRAIGQRQPQRWLLLFWAFMLCSVTVHAIFAYPGDQRLSQLVLALTLFATGGLILPTATGGFALTASSAALFFLFALEYSTQALQKAAIPLIVSFMALLLFLARRWAIKQSVKVRMLDRRLSISQAQTESANRVAELSLRISAGFGHHFNNLLQGALVGAEGLRSAVGREHAASHWLDIVELAVNRGVGLTARLQHYAQPRPFELHRLAGDEFVAQLDLSSAISPQRPVLRSAAPVGFVADATQLSIAILELVRNADTSMTDKAAPIRLALADDDDAVQITVTDSGRGIPASLEGNATAPFVTGDPVNRFGLGLAIAAQIAERHQGELTHRAAPEGGTIASLRIPKSLRSGIAPER